ncbi:MAG TPA: hypothetical protein VEC57_04935 [Candidatus Limnocylindrales bacterium]|nr:hypothetical protein [Candidatus Limnocylindrales bacterium]
MKTAAQYAVCASLAAGLILPLAAAADETTVIRETPDGYVETYKGPDGSYTHKQSGPKSKTAYEGNGVQFKESSNGVVTKRVYQDANCQQKTVSNAKTGETTVVSEGNCPR